MIKGTIVSKKDLKSESENSTVMSSRAKCDPFFAPRVKDLGTHWPKMRRNFELFDDEGGVFKIQVLRTKWVRLLSSARLFLFLFCGNGKKEKLI